MLCSTCSKEIGDALVCPHCRAMHAYNQQKLKLGNIQKKQQKVIAESFKSPYFLVYMIALIFMVLVHVCMFMGLVISILSKAHSLGGSIPSLICLLFYILLMFAPIRAMISAIQLYCVKEADSIPVKMQGLKAMPGFWQKVFVWIRFFLILFFTILLIVMTVMLVGVIKGAQKIDQFGEQAGAVGFDGISSAANILSSGATAGSIILFVVMIVLFVLMILLISRCKGTYEKLGWYFTSLTDTYTSGAGALQTTPSVSVTGMFVLGGLFVGLGAGTFGFGNGLITGMWSFGGFFLSNGIYLIVNGIFLKHTEQGQIKVALEYKMEKAKLETIGKESNAIQRQLLQKAREEENRRLAEEREEKERLQRAALEEERMRKELELQEKNNELMRKMMKTFMENGGIAMAQAQNMFMSNEQDKSQDNASDKKTDI